MKLFHMRIVLLGFLPVHGLKLNSNISVIDADDCGLLTSFPNAKPKDYRDARPTKYSSASNGTVKNVHASGATIVFKCLPGFTTDGSKDGATEFNVECLAKGYYEPDAVCSAASKCGALPNITSAFPTGKSNKGKVQYACTKGYSLDGEKVSPGVEKNTHFDVKCIDFKGQYEKFTGKCQPWAFVPASETIRMYNQVFKALFTVSCKGTIKREFGKCGDEDCAPPAGLDTACSKIIADGYTAAATTCATLVTQIKTAWTAKKAERATFDAAEERDANWMEEGRNADRPHLHDASATFCDSLWTALTVTVSSDSP